VLLQVPDHLAAHVGIALLRYIRAAERDGLTPPRELAGLAGELTRDPQRDAASRRRALAAARSRRWRARQREARAS